MLRSTKLKFFLNRFLVIVGSEQIWFSIFALWSSAWQGSSQDFINRGERGKEKKMYKLNKSQKRIARRLEFVNRSVL